MTYRLAVSRLRRRRACRHRGCLRRINCVARKVISIRRRSNAPTICVAETPDPIDWARPASTPLLGILREALSSPPARICGYRVASSYLVSRTDNISYIKCSPGYVVLLYLSFPSPYSALPLSLGRVASISRWLDSDCCVFAAARSSCSTPISEKYSEA